MDNVIKSTNEKIKSVDDMMFTLKEEWNKKWYYLVWKVPSCTILQSGLKGPDYCTVWVSMYYRDDNGKLIWSVDLTEFADNIEEWKRLLMNMYNTLLDFKPPTWKE